MFAGFFVLNTNTIYQAKVISIHPSVNGLLDNLSEYNGRIGTLSRVCDQFLRVLLGDFVATRF